MRKLHRSSSVPKNVAALTSSSISSTAHVRYLLLLMGTVLALLVISQTAAAAGRCGHLFADKSAPSVEVARYDEKLPWGMQALARTLDLLSIEFEKVKKQKPVQLLLEFAKNEPLRGFAFRMELLTGKYAKKDPKFFEPLKEGFKLMEDSLGDVKLYDQLMNWANTLGHNGLFKHFSSLRATEEDKLTTALEEFDWVANPREAAKRIKSDLYDYAEWKEADKDRAKLAKFVYKEMVHLDEDLRAGKFNDKDIEKGLHELRRKLRKISILLGTLDGMVETQNDRLSNKLENWLAELRTANPKIMENKYAKFPPAEVTRPIRVPKLHYLILSELIGKTGEEKDPAEVLVKFEEALKAIGASKRESEEVLATLDKLLVAHYQLQGKPRLNHQQVAQALQDRLVETNLLRDMAEEFAEMNGLTKSNEAE